MNSQVYGKAHPKGRIILIFLQLNVIIFKKLLLTLQHNEIVYGW